MKMVEPAKFRRAAFDLRGYVARKLLGLANRIDPDCKIMCDWKAGWIFKRAQTQQIMGEYADYHAEPKP